MQKTEHQYLTLLINIQYCMHFAELQTHFGAGHWSLRQFYPVNSFS